MALITGLHCILNHNFPVIGGGGLDGVIIGASGVGGGGGGGGGC